MKYIWSILGDSSMIDVPVFATSALTTKSRVTFSDHVEMSTVVPYSEIYGVHPKILFSRTTRMVQKYGVCKWTGKSFNQLAKRVVAHDLDFH